MVGVMDDLREAFRAAAIKFVDGLYDMTVQRFAEKVSSVFGTPVQTQRVEQAQPRRQGLSQDRLEETLASIIEMLEKSPEGLRSEQIRARLKIDKRQFQLAANLGKTSDQIVQTGERRATMYSLPSVKASKALAEGRVIKKKRG